MEGASPSQPLIGCMTFMYIKPTSSAPAAVNSIQRYTKINEWQSFLQEKWLPRCISWSISSVGLLIYLLGSAIFLEYVINKINKKICTFSGLCPMRQCVSGNISRASSRIFSATPRRACLMAGWKGANTKSPPLAVKKVRLRRYKKWLPHKSHIVGL